MSELFVLRYATHISICLPGYISKCTETFTLKQLVHQHFASKGLVSPTVDLVEDLTEAGRHGLPASGEEKGRTHGIPLVFTLLRSSVYSCSLP